MARKTIGWAQFEDFEIKESGAKVGTVRINPSSVKWKPKGKQTWFSLTIEQLAALAEEHGKVTKR